MFLSKKNAPKIIFVIVLSILLTSCAFMAYIQEVYSDSVDITGCYQTRPKNPNDTLTLSVRESDHKFIIFTAGFPVKVLAFGKYETILKKEKTAICRVNTESGIIYIYIYNKKAYILGLDGKEYKLNKVGDIYSLINIDDKEIGCPPCDIRIGLFVPKSSDFILTKCFIFKFCDCTFALFVYWDDRVT